MFYTLNSYNPKNKEKTLFQFRQIENKALICDNQSQGYNSNDSSTRECLWQTKEM